MITEDNAGLCLLSWHFFVKTHVFLAVIGHNWGKAAPLIERLKKCEP